MDKRQNSKRMPSAARQKAKRLREPIPDESESEVATHFVPQTQFGRRLWKIRQRILAGGQPLLEWKEIEMDLRERRGEHGGEA